jgi:hypothetical protein
LFSFYANNSAFFFKFCQLKVSGQNKAFSKWRGTIAPLQKPPPLYTLPPHSLDIVSIFINIFPMCYSWCKILENVHLIENLFNFKDRCYQPTHQTLNYLVKWHNLYRGTMYNLLSGKYPGTYWTYHCLFGVFWYLLNSHYVYWVFSDTYWKYPYCYWQCTDTY